MPPTNALPAFQLKNEPWLIHVNVWQNPLLCCEVISHQLIKINEKKKKERDQKKKKGRASWELWTQWVKAKLEELEKETLETFYSSV